MIPLNKLLPEFFLPLGVSLVLVAWGTWRSRRRLLVLGLATLVVASHPSTAWLAMRLAEGWAERVPPASLPLADAVVVLSYGRTVAPGPEHIVEWGDPDRFFGGVEVFRAGRAPRLIFTAARASGRAEDPSEGHLLAGLARTLGVPAESILVTEPVLTTSDEARETRTLLAAAGVERPSVVLVTTAWHMPRAAEQFRGAGLQVHPFPVDFQSQNRFKLSWTRLLPRPGALMMTHTALRELYGRWYYRFRAMF